MEATTFDGISRNFGSVSTRRGFVRLLGGAAVLGAALADGEESEAKKGRDKGRQQVSAQGKGKKKITICYQGQTRTVKKKGYQTKFPGATKGACPRDSDQGGDSDQGDGGQNPQICTQWLISGGPNQSDRLAADDDLSIFNLSKGGQGILFGDNNRLASTYAPVPFDATVGDKLKIVAFDGGGCRSVSPLWLHCRSTGQKRLLYPGYTGAGCNYQSGTFVNEQVEVWI